MQTFNIVCALSKLAQSITNMACRKTENTHRKYTWIEDSEKLYDFDNENRYYFESESPIHRMGSY